MFRNVTKIQTVMVMVISIAVMAVFLSMVQITASQDIQVLSNTQETTVLAPTLPKTTYLKQIHKTKKSSTYQMTHNLTYMTFFEKILVTRTRNIRALHAVEYIDLDYVTKVLESLIKNLRY